MDQGLATAQAASRLSDNDVQAVDNLRSVYSRLRQELGRVIVGQHAVIERLSLCLFARGHAALDGRARSGQNPAR